MKEWDRVIRKADGRHGVVTGTDHLNQQVLVNWDGEENGDGEELVPVKDLKEEH